MATVSTLVVAFAPQFTGDARIDTFTDIVAERLTASAWGVVYTQAVAWYVCHLLTVLPASSSADTGGTRAAGPLTGRSAGGQSESYGAVGVTVSVDQEDAELMRTVYGRQFLALRNSRPGATTQLVQVG